MGVRQFHGRLFDSDTSRLLVNGEPVHVPPNSAKLLNRLLSNIDQTVPRDQLKIAVWGNDEMSDGSLEQEVSRLRGLIGDKKQRAVIVTNSTIGYFIPRDPGTTLDRLPEPILVFPGNLKADGGSISSWLGCGKADKVYPRQVTLPKQKLQRPQVPVDRSDRDQLAIRFDHRPDISEECYWVAVIPFGTTENSIRWPVVDLTTHNILAFTARFESADEPNKVMILGVRLEDATNHSTVSSRHNQTGWYPEEVKVGPTPRQFVLYLDNFIWTEYGWPTNWQSVDRRRMLQIDFGQDNEFPAAYGVLYLSNIRVTV